MMDIQIKQGEGLSQAIKRVLKNEGAEESKLQGSVWSKIQQALASDDENTFTHNGNTKKMGDVWTSLKTNVMTFVNDVIKVSESTWNTIRAAVGLTGASAATESEETAGSANETEAPTETPAETPSTRQTDSAGATTNTEQARKDAEAVKVTVRTPERLYDKPTNKAEVDSIIQNQKEGREVANKIRNALNSLTPPFGPGDVDKAEETLKLITKENVAYVLEAFPDIMECIDGVDAFGYGFDKDEIWKYIIKPLFARGRELDLDLIISIDKNESIDSYKAKAAKIREAITKKERETVSDYTNQMAEYNRETSMINHFNKNKAKIQKAFDDANNLLAEVANMNPKPEITKGENSAKITLPDGRWIEVVYNKDSGEIGEIKISCDSTNNSHFVEYSDNFAYYDVDENNSYFSDYEGRLSNDCYDFEKLKALAQKIFG